MQVADRGEKRRWEKKQDIVTRRYKAKETMKLVQKGKVTLEKETWLCEKSGGCQACNDKVNEAKAGR